MTGTLCFFGICLEFRLEITISPLQLHHKIVLQNTGDGEKSFSDVKYGLRMAAGRSATGLLRISKGQTEPARKSEARLSNRERNFALVLLLRSIPSTKLKRIVAIWSRVVISASRPSSAKHRAPLPLHCLRMAASRSAARLEQAAGG